MVKLYIPLDMAAVAMGADRLAAAVAQEAAARGETIEIVRNGSRGMLWLEPLIEVETSRGPCRLRAGQGQGRRVAV